MGNRSTDAGRQLDRLLRLGDKYQTQTRGGNQHCCRSNSPQSLTINRLVSERIDALRRIAALDRIPRLTLSIRWVAPGRMQKL